MAIREKILTEDQLRNLNALCKFLGAKIAEKAFSYWEKKRSATIDSVIEKLMLALANLP